MNRHHEVIGIEREETPFFGNTWTEKLRPPLWISCLNAAVCIGIEAKSVGQYLFQQQRKATFIIHIKTVFLGMSFDRRECLQERNNDETCRFNRKTMCKDGVVLTNELNLGNPGLGFGGPTALLIDHVSQPILANAPRFLLRCQFSSCPFGGATKQYTQKDESH